MSPSRSTELTGSSIREDNFTRRQQLNSNNPTPPPIKWDEQPSSRSSSSLLRKPLSISSSRESPHVLPTLKSTHSLDDLPETLNYRTTPSLRPSSRGSASLGYPSKYSPQFSPVMYSSPIKGCTDKPLTTITENSEEILNLRELNLCRGNLKMIGRILNEGDQQSDEEEAADFSTEKLINSYGQNLLIDTTNLFEKILKRCTSEESFTKYRNGELSLEALQFPPSVDREELEKTHRKLVAREEELLAVRAAKSSTIHNRIHTIQGKIQQLLTILFRENFTNGPEEIVNILKELRRMSELYPEIKEQILSYTREFHGLWESTQGKTKDKRGSYITISKKRAALANKIADDNPLEKRIKAKKLANIDMDQGKDFSP
ncbi:MAG: hypothetical protein K2Y01_04890 [Rhabdochlamydiaceae bacterium]|nr:hypothetical protein [Rhabdochlamydiaceae bacterium]